LYPNPNIQDLEHVSNPCASTRTQADGSYVVAALPGPGVLAFRAYRAKDPYMPALITRQEVKDFFQDGHDYVDREYLRVAVSVAAQSILNPGSYHALVLLNPDRPTESLTHDVALETARKLRGQVVGPDGQPVSGVFAYGLWPNVFSWTVLPADTFTVMELNPRRSRALYLHHPDKGLGTAREIRSDEAEPITVRLEPCGSFTGRLLDTDGQPVANLTVELDRVGTREGLYKARTDADGRFRMDNVVPRQKYRVQVDHGDFGKPVFGTVALEPGETKDLGEAKVKLEN
jgi:hypothetical protein